MNKFISALSLIIFLLINQISKADSWNYKILRNFCMLSDFHTPENDLTDTGLEYTKLSDEYNFPKDIYKARINTKYLTVKKYMSLLENTLIKIHKKIPHLSPKETEWLEKELEVGFSKRYIKAIQTPEYAQMEFLEIIHFKLYLVKEIKKTQDKKLRQIYLINLARSFLSQSGRFDHSYKNLIKFKIIDPFPKHWIFTGLEFNHLTRQNQIAGAWNDIAKIILNCYVLKNKFD